MNEDKKLHPGFSLKDISIIGSVEARVIEAPKNTGIWISDKTIATPNKIPVSAIDLVTFDSPINKTTSRRGLWWKDI